eukprot:scpid21797/ scgid3102/ RNA-directed DNA polymerase from mobile element jockey; Reverse transcriptase
MAHTTDPLPLNPHAPAFTPSSPLQPSAPVSCSYTHIKVGHINICSLRHKTHIIAKLIDQHALDLLAVTETWLDSSISDNEVSVPGAILFRRDRPCAEGCSCLSSCSPCRKGGGICMYVNDQVNVTPVLTHSHASLELMWLRTGTVNDGVLFGCIYRPPSESVEYWTRLATATEQLDSENVVLLGDVNVDFLHQASSVFQHLKNTLLLPCGMANKVQDATRITASTRTSIDCILTNIDLVTSASVIDCEFSDHRLVLSTVPLPTAGTRNSDTDGQQPSRQRRDYRGFDADRFCGMLLSSNLHHFATTDTDLMLDEWAEKFNAALDIAAPYVPRKRPKRNRKTCPFMTKALLDLIRERKSAFKKLKAANFRDMVIMAQFKRLRSQSNNLYRHLQNRYFADRCRTYEREPRQFWKILNTITKRTPQRQTVTIPAERLNDYFHAIVTDNHATYDLPMGPANSTDLRTFEAVTVSEVKRLISALQSRKAPGPDGIMPFLLKVSKDVVALSLTILYNTSLSSGHFPSRFKIAHITPILKSKQGPRNCPSNHRPVSLTSILAKLLEQLVFSRLQVFFQERCPFHEDQFGFRKHRSTEQLLTKVTNDWLLAREAGLHTAVVCVDLKKAFDTVQHQQLLIAIAAVGISGIALAWLQSYLRGRQQRVVTYIGTSPLVPVTSGVPQGTILGPVLFNLYVRKLPLTADALSCKLPMFADDMTLYASRRSPNEAVGAVNKVLSVLALDLADLGQGCQSTLPKLSPCSFPNSPCTCLFL